MIEFTINGEPRVIMLRYVPLFALAVGLLSLLIPLAAWWLGRIGWLSEATQRRIVAVWLGTTIVGTVAAWAIWAMDHRERSTDSFSPWLYGLLIAIVVVSLLTPAWRRHSQDAHVRAQDLWRGLLRAILNVGIFWFWFYAALMLVLAVAISGNAPLAALFMPTSLLFVVLALALVLYLAVPRLIRGGVGLWQEMQQQARQEREFLEACAGNEEQLLKLAVEPVLRALAYRLRCNTTDLAELTFDPSQHRRVNEACWLMGGSVRVRPSLGPWPQHYWRASIEIVMGKVRANVVEIAISTLQSSHEAAKPAQKA